MIERTSPFQFLITLDVSSPPRVLVIHRAAPPPARRPSPTPPIIPPPPTRKRRGELWPEQRALDRRPRRTLKRGDSARALAAPLRRARVPAVNPPPMHPPPMHPPPMPLPIDGILVKLLCLRLIAEIELIVDGTLGSCAVEVSVPDVGAEGLPRARFGPAAGVAHPAERSEPSGAKAWERCGHRHGQRREDRRELRRERGKLPRQTEVAHRAREREHAAHACKEEDECGENHHRRDPAARATARARVHSREPIQSAGGVARVARHEAVAVAHGVRAPAVCGWTVLECHDGDARAAIVALEAVVALVVLLRARAVLAELGALVLLPIEARRGALPAGVAHLMAEEALLTAQMIGGGPELVVGRWRARMLNALAPRLVQLGEVELHENARLATCTVDDKHLRGRGG